MLVWRPATESMLAERFDFMISGEKKVAWGNGLEGGGPGGADPGANRPTSSRQNKLLTKGVGYLTWKWICISLKSRMVSWYKNEIVQAGVSNCMHQCLNCLLLNVHIFAHLGSRGKPFFQNFEVFSVSADCRLVRICMY
jgi:hypothetical protein